jgi:hypothetical protein
MAEAQADGATPETQPDVSRRADRMAAYLTELGVFDTIERAGTAGIRVSVWLANAELRGETVSALLVVAPR